MQPFEAYFTENSICSHSQLRDSEGTLVTDQSQGQLVLCILGSFMLTRVSGQFIVRLKFFSKVHALEFKSSALCSGGSYAGTAELQHPPIFTVNFVFMSIYCVTLIFKSALTKSVDNVSSGDSKEGTGRAMHPQIFGWLPQFCA